MEFELLSRREQKVTMLAGEYVVVMVASGIGTCPMRKDVGAVHADLSGDDECKGERRVEDEPAERCAETARTAERAVGMESIL